MAAKEKKAPCLSLNEKQKQAFEAFRELMRKFGHDLGDEERFDHAQECAVEFLKKIIPVFILGGAAVALHYLFFCVTGNIAEAACLDLVSLTVTAPGTGAAMSVVTGDSQYIANGADKKAGGFLVPERILGLAAWCKAQAVGYTQWVWPSLGEQVRGNRIRNVVNDPKAGIGKVGWRFRPTDPLTVTQVGSATAGDVETAHLLLWYENLPGTSSRLITLDEVRKRGVQEATVEATISPSGGGAYSGEELLNAESDLLQTGADYAVLGACIGITCGALAIRGRDNGGLRYGIPGSTDRHHTANFFMDLALAYDLPVIPVISANNRANTFLSVVQDENTTAVPISLNLVQLDRRFETKIEEASAGEGPQVAANA